MENIHEVIEPQLVEVPSHHVHKKNCECEGNQVEHCHCSGQDAQDNVLPTKEGQGWLIQPKLPLKRCLHHKEK